MTVNQVRLNVDIRALAAGSITAAAQATIGAPNLVADDPAQPRATASFVAWEGMVIVGTTAIASVNMLTGVATASSGSPNLTGVTGKDWEGAAISATKVRAIVIRNSAIETGATLKVETTDSNIIAIGDGCTLTLTAPKGKDLTSEYHTLLFATASGNSRAYITAILEIVH